MLTELGPAGWSDLGTCPFGSVPVTAPSLPPVTVPGVTTAPPGQEYPTPVPLACPLVVLPYPPGADCGLNFIN